MRLPDSKEAEDLLNMPAQINSRTKRFSSLVASMFTTFLIFLHTLTSKSSGIGRSVSVLMAREGADITIVYLPQEQHDAEETKAMVEAENRTCLLIPGDLRKYDFCRQAVEEHIKR